MRRSAGWGIAILLFALAAGAATFWVVRSHRADEPHGTVLDALPELEWVRDELHLSDEQFAKVRELHMDYRPKCEEMCARILKSHEDLDRAARSARSLSPGLRDTIERHARVHAECQQAMVEHLYRTAEVLNKDQAARYLEAMLPYALDFSHSEPDGLHEH